MDYRTYIRSNAWKRRRRAYWDAHQKLCACCLSTTSVALHHLSYDRLGHERDMDLVPLCGHHHTKFHRQYRRPCRENFALFLLNERHTRT